MKKTMIWAIALGLAITTGWSVAASMPSKTKNKPLTLLVVPSRYSILQVAFDLSRRFPAVLVSYQGSADTERPVLHAWNGEQWVYVSMKDFREGNFVQVTPDRAVLIGDEATLPTALTDALSWCPTLLNVRDMNTADLLNSAGRLFQFNREDWAWFAGRYRLNLQDLNADARTQSWYDQPRTRFLQEEQMLESGPMEPWKEPAPAAPLRTLGEKEPAEPLRMREPVMEDIPPARVMFEEPVAIDPSFAPVGGELE